MRVKVNLDKEALVKESAASAEPAMAASVDAILERAREIVPVRTGRLKASIQRRPMRVGREASIEFGAYAPYAARVEYGAAGRPGRFYMTQAIAAAVRRD